MKKIALTVALIAGVVAGTMALSAFTKSEPKNDCNTIVTTTEMSDGCSFEVINVYSTISGTKVTVNVTVAPSFTPEGSGSYTVIVKPNGSLRNILDSQSKSLTFYYQKSKWDKQSKSVEFYCDVHDNTYNQCSNQSFSTSCFKN